MARFYKQSFDRNGKSLKRTIVFIGPNGILAMIDCAHPSQEYVSDLQGLTALVCIVGGSSVMAWGLLGRWRRRARIAIAATGIVCFVFGYGVLIIPALLDNTAKVSHDDVHTTINHLQKDLNDVP